MPQSRERIGSGIGRLRQDRSRLVAKASPSLGSAVTATIANGGSGPVGRSTTHSLRRLGRQVVAITAGIGPVQLDLRGASIKFMRSASPSSKVHGAASGSPASTATGRHTKSAHALFALRRSTTTPTGMRTSGSARLMDGRQLRGSAGRSADSAASCADTLSARHGQDKINRLAGKAVDDDAGITKRQPEKADDAARSSSSSAAAVPQRVADPGRLGVKPDIPGRARRRAARSAARRRPRPPADA